MAKQITNLQFLIIFVNIVCVTQRCVSGLSKACLNPAQIASLNPRLVGGLVVYKIRATGKPPESHGLS